MKFQWVNFALGIGVDDMDDGFELAHHLAPNEPVEDSSMLLAILLRRSGTVRA
ncbi:uncharacterized protein ARMOST_07612 [Armillaria ostoyae]|uniref:Uncharacterized protein n=1 Tax=Armillaria ostoyae TaxID=47428 RepID=A0A284R6A9_ARMOS|nr:uncharacterized protein ARMOST_07612 [Armillaria ostoyae]